MGGEELISLFFQDRHLLSIGGPAYLNACVPAAVGIDALNVM
jgi:hypothetical protein